MNRFVSRVTPAVVLLLCGTLAPAAEPPTRSQAAAGLRKAVAFFREKVAVGGGYVWRYSADLTKREGEGKVGATTVWVQPPGTPTVGEALVEVYELTRGRYYLDAARESAMALLRGQMHSGGWMARIELDPARRRRYAYRADGKPAAKARDYSSLDDDQTQSALRFLMRYDKATAFADKPVHEAVLYGLDRLLAAQFPNGGWPQVYRGPADASKHPVKPAGYRESGRYPRIKAYSDFYTLNDNLMGDVIDTLLRAWRVYDEKRYRQAALRAGDFLILAQMPQPQPGWAQQYDFDMCPAWARKFEPPAITGGESQQVMMTLMDLYELTGQRKYVEPIGRALAYYKRSLLPDGRLARFYELKTNRPLYFTRDYKLTYDDADMPTHYAFKIGSSLGRIEKRYDALTSRPWRQPPQARASASRPSGATVRRVLDAMDDRGAWVEAGKMRYWPKADPTRKVIDPRTFVRNVRLLARYVSAG